MSDALKFWLAKTLVEIGVWLVVVVPLLVFCWWLTKSEKR